MLLGRNELSNLTDPGTDGDGVKDSWIVSRRDGNTEIYRDIFPYQKDPDVEFGLYYIW